MNEYIEEIEERTHASPWDSGAYTPMPERREYIRREMVKKYAWAIPNDEAIDVLVEESPILEIGAGNGYWAKLAREAGADVRAVDKDPPEDTWASVEEGEHTVAAGEQERALFLCWPSYGGQWASEALSLYEGDVVIYVGEGRGGCTGDKDFHRMLMEDWGRPETTIRIPRWEALHDRLHVFKR